MICAIGNTMIGENEGFIKYLLENGAEIFPICLDRKDHHGITIEFNPGIAIVDDSILVSLRSSDYMLWQSYNHDITLGDKFFGYFCDDIIHSWLYMYKLNENDAHDNEFQLVDIDDSRNFTIFRGIEDCRLVVWDNKTYACGTSREGNDGWEARIHMIELDTSDSNKIVEANHYVIPVKDEKSCEKNWMPINDKPFTWIRWTNPMEIIEYDIKTGKSSTTRKDVDTRYRTDLKGSSNLIKVDGYYYAFVHSTDLFEFFGSWHRKYLSCLVKFDNDLNIVAQSKPLEFDQNFLIHFVCGMAYDGKNAYISYSIDDSIPYIVKAPIGLLTRLV